LTPAWRSQVLADCIRFTKSGEAWEALFLGCVKYYPVARSKALPGSIWRCRVFNTHAYVVSRAGMRLFLDHPPCTPLADGTISPEHVDAFYMKIWDHCFCHVQQSCFDQDDSPTDNVKFAWLPHEYINWFDRILRHWTWMWIQDHLVQASMLLPLSWRQSTFAVGMPILLNGELVPIRANMLVAIFLQLYILLVLVWWVPPPCGRLMAPFKAYGMFLAWAAHEKEHHEKQRAR